MMDSRSLAKAVSDSVFRIILIAAVVGATAAVTIVGLIWWTW